MTGPDPRMQVHLALKGSNCSRRPTDLAAQLGLPVPTVRRAVLMLHGGGFVQRDVDINTHAEDPRYHIRSRLGRVPHTLKRLTRGGNWSTLAEIADESSVDRDAALDALEIMQKRKTAHTKRVGHITLWRYGRSSK